jgi:hypothetical protein
LKRRIVAARPDAPGHAAVFGLALQHSAQEARDECQAVDLQEFLISRWSRTPRFTPQKSCAAVKPRGTDNPSLRSSFSLAVVILGQGLVGSHQCLLPRWVRAPAAQRLSRSKGISASVESVRAVECLSTKLAPSPAVTFDSMDIATFNVNSDFTTSQVVSSSQKTCF